MEGDYREHEPPETLRPFVRLVWTYSAPGNDRAVQRIAPDGCPELVVDIGEPYEEEDRPGGGWRVQPRALFAGQMTRPLALRPRGPIELAAVRFEPDGARDWLGAPLSTATDRRLDMSDRLAGLALPSGDPAAQAERLAAFVEAARAAGGWSVDPAVRQAVRDAEAAAAPQSRAAAEQRALQRRFADRVGVSPRLLRSVFRFRRVFDRAADPGAAEGWLSAGLEAGYFDQPQMARDFRRFLGCTATEWARDQVGLARAIASQTYKRGPLQTG